MRPKVKPRDHIGAMRAQRALLDHVLADGDATPGHLRIALALTQLVTSYSRLSDGIARSEIAKTARVSEATVKRTLALWHERGWVDWQPSTTRGKVSRLSFPQAEVEPRVTQGDPTTKSGGGKPRVIQSPSATEPRVTMDDPLPERKHSGENAARMPSTRSRRRSGTSPRQPSEFGPSSQALARW